MRTCAALVALLAAACAGAPPGQQSATGDKRLQDALRFDEQRTDGRSRNLAASRHLDELDYQSELVITPDRALLRALAGAPPSALAPLSAADEARLAELRALAGVAESAEQRAEEAAAALAAADAARAQGPLDAELIQKTVALLNAEAQGRAALLEHVSLVLRAQVQREQPGLSGDDLDVRVGQLAEVYTPDDKKIDFEKVSKLLREEIEAISRQYKRDVAAVEGTLPGQSAFGFRLRAKLFSGDESGPVHVANYDDQAESFSGKPPRISFGSAADQQRLASELQAIQVIVSAAKQGAGGELDISERLSALAKALREDAKKLASSLGAAGDLGSVLDAAIDDPQTPTADKTKLEALRKWIGDAKKLVESVETLVGSGGQRSLADWMASVKTLDALGRDLMELLRGERLADLGPGAQALLSFAKRKLEAAGQDPAALIPTASAELQRQLEELRARFSELGLVTSAVMSRLTSHSVRSAATGVAVPTRTLNLDDVVAGTIRLNRTLADRGDELDVTAELVRKQGEDYTVLQEATRSFRVDRFGLVSELSADVAFVRQSGESHFRTAPAASWTLHYRVPDEQDDSGWKNTWQVVDPGLGISVAGISTDAESFQPGVGLHLSLFHDVLKAGYGYNLSADSDRGYFFVGIGLFEALQGVGNLFGGLSTSTQRRNP